MRTLGSAQIGDHITVLHLADRSATGDGFGDGQHSGNVVPERSQCGHGGILLRGRHLLRSHLAPLLLGDLGSEHGLRRLHHHVLGQPSAQHASGRDREPGPTGGGDRGQSELALVLGVGLRTVHADQRVLSHLTEGVERGPGGFDGVRYRHQQHRHQQAQGGQPGTHHGDRPSADPVALADPLPPGRAGRRRGGIGRHTSIIARARRCRGTAGLVRRERKHRSESGPAPG